MPDHVIRISKLRETLGWAYLTVSHTDDPVVIQRYNRRDVVMVPLWEWQFLKELEAKIQAGEKPWEDADESDDP